MFRKTEYENSPFFSKEFWSKNPSAVLLSGGIGNQLFQYCFSRSIAIATKTVVYFDLSYYSLQHFKNSRVPILKDLISNEDLFYNSISYKDKIMPRLSQQKSDKAKKAYFGKLEELAKSGLFDLTRQSNQIFDSSIERKTGAYYSGAFTSHQYWINSAAEEFRHIDFLLTHYIYQKGKKFPQGEIDVVIHARRGDYSKNPKTRRIHGVYGFDFYLMALQSLESTVSEEFRSILIASDETRFSIDLAGKIKTAFPHLRVSVEHESNPLFLLRKLSESRVFIGGNSTFSWWIANLGPEKRRILPKNWFHEGEFGYDPTTFFPRKTELFDFSFEL